MFLGSLFLLSMMIFVYEATSTIKLILASKDGQEHGIYYLFLSLPNMVLQVTSPSLMFSVCFVVGQFSVNKELVSIMVAGVSFLRIITPLIFFGIFVWILVTLLNQFMVVPFNKKAQYHYGFLVKGSGKMTDLVYQYHVRGSEGFYYVYFFDQKEKTIKGGFNYLKMGKDGFPEYILSAQKAKYDPSTKLWTLFTIEEIHFTKDLELEKVENIPEKKYAFPEDMNYFSKVPKKLEELNVLEIADEIQERKNKGIPYRDLEVERFSVFAMPFMNFIVIIIGAISGAITKRSAGVASLGLTIGVVLLYYISYSTFRTLGENGAIPAFWSVWITPILFLASGIYLFKKFNL